MNICPENQLQQDISKYLIFNKNTESKNNGQYLNLLFIIQSSINYFNR